MKKCEKCGENVSIAKHCKESFSVKIDKNGNAHYFHFRCVFEENNEPEIDEIIRNNPSQEI